MLDKFDPQKMSERELLILLTSEVMELKSQVTGIAALQDQEALECPFNPRRKEGNGNKALERIKLVEDALTIAKSLAEDVKRLRDTVSAIEEKHSKRLKDIEDTITRTEGAVTTLRLIGIGTIISIIIGAAGWLRPV